MPTLNQKGIAQIFIILILVAGIVAGVYLVQQTQIFKPRAYQNDNILSYKGSILSPRAAIDKQSAGISPVYFSLQQLPDSPSPSQPEEGVKLSPEEILAAPTNSGWVYIANIRPDDGITFWLTITKIHQNTALLYGITDTIQNRYYSGFLTGGTINTSGQKDYMISYSSNGQQLVKAYQEHNVEGVLGTGLGLRINLPWPTKDHPQRRYTKTQHLPWNGDVIWESGDGVVPLTKDLLSWYISFTFDKKLWMDVQKFNLLQEIDNNIKRVNHRWGSFILTKDVGKLAQGTPGVWWEILDSQNNRQSAGFTNFDLKSPRPFGTQQTREDFKIIPLEIYDSGNKKYLKKWHLIQEDLNVNLIMETIIPNQENSILGEYFYEGATKILTASGEEVGFGMLEQTHREE